jgi:ankyrin repeat protein
MFELPAALRAIFNIFSKDYFSLFCGPDPQKKNKDYFELFGVPEPLEKERSPAQIARDELRVQELIQKMSPVIAEKNGDLALCKYTGNFYLVTNERQSLLGNIDVKTEIHLFEEAQQHIFIKWVRWDRMFKNGIHPN